MYFQAVLFNGLKKYQRLLKNLDGQRTDDFSSPPSERWQPSDEGRELTSSSQDTEMVESACHGENEQGEVEEKVESQLQVEDDTNCEQDNVFMTQPDIDSRQRL